MSRKRKGRKKQKTLAVFDIETDPFLHGRIPKPFCCEIYTPEYNKQFWGPDCIIDFYNWLRFEEEEYLIYAHNGGKFDFMYLFWLGVLTDIKLINGRIVKCKIGNQELRDSYAIMPIPLGAYQKTEIDYDKFEEENREENKVEILSYLHDDCVFLFDLVSAFWDRFGDNLTIGGTALKQLRERHPFENQDETHDTLFRNYYFGGRVEFFDSGIIKGDYTVYDVNSMYPSVMKDEQHPTGRNYLNYGDDLESAWEQEFFFIELTGNSKGAFPVRTKTGLEFPHGVNTFYTTSHELKIALKHDLIIIHEVHKILAPQKTINFSLYVNHFIKDKIEAKESNDKIGELFAKLLLNSAYGKFGQNPENFKDYIIRYPDEPLPDLDIWDLYIDTGYLEIWEKPTPKPVYYDVATAASITSAARAMLLDALHSADTPIYCDTDSIICKQLNGVEIHPTNLGAWDIEAECDKIAIAGKKLYAAFKDGECVKKANKGVKLSGDEIVAVALGKEIAWENPAPSFSVANETRFIKRNVVKRV